MKIVIDKESIIKVFAVAFYAVSGGDYSAVKDVVKELLEKIGYEPYEDRTQVEWIINDEVTCKCSLCQYPMTYLLSPQRSGLHFCPYCGAKMERSDEKNV